MVDECVEEIIAVACAIDALQNETSQERNEN